MEVLSASVALYVLLGLTSLAVRWRTRRQASSQLRLQVEAWWWIFPVVSVALALYPLGPLFLALLIGALAARELSAFTPRPKRQFLLQFALFGAAVFAAATNRVQPAIAACVIGFCLLAVLRMGQQASRLVWLLLLLTAASISIVSAFPVLPLQENTKLSWLFYLFVLTALNDIGQFVSGKLFGSARIAPTISPNKTWQGLLGGIAISVLVSLCLGNWLGLGSPERLAAYGAVLSLFGFLGDLLFSGAKRSLGIKDFSNLIPGHGGILDRVDSLVLTAPLLYLLLQCYR